ncbi:SdpI family protein [Gephyromycinifex aptenodytis]|uniref:DUF1648 domain-containing protein n=1 Tax=Gephyromycinifex aptenodytis TaxID=2716227 RepID=UPI001444CFA1|nr:DUF1648 domain-containing protein [Gephyromycinifex aptenodytis]
MRAWVRGLYVLAWVLLVGVVVWSAFALPENPASHFGPSGAADGYMSRAGSVAVGFAIGAATLIGLPLLGWALARGSGAGVNIPHKDYWFASPERVAAFRPRFVDDMLLFAAMTGFLLSYGTVEVVLANRRTPPHSGNGMWFALALYLPGTVWWIFALYRRYRPPQDGTPSAVREN